MAFDFPATSFNNNHVYLADDAVLTRPNGDWAVGGLEYYDSGSQPAAGFPYMMSWGTYGETPSINLFHNESGPTWRVYVVDDAGNSTGDRTVQNPIGTDQWNHFLVQRVSGNVESWYNGTRVDNHATGLASTINSTREPTWAQRSDRGSGFQANSSHAEWAWWDRSLSAEEIAALSNGFSPRFFQRDMVIYMPMLREQVEFQSNLTVTVGADVTVIPHPRMIYPSSNTLILPASGSGNSGTAAITLGAASVAATGDMEVGATSSITLAAPVIAASGDQPMSGTAALQLANTVLAASGVTGDADGTAALALSRVVIAASGGQIFIGSGSLTLANAIIAASGSFGDEATGTASLTLANAILAASGEQPMSGTAAIELAATVLAATGDQPISGTAALQLATIELAAFESLPGSSGSNIAALIRQLRRRRTYH